MEDVTCLTYKMILSFFFWYLSVPPKAKFQLSYPEKSVDNYVSFNLSSSAPALTEFTLCVWIKVADQSDDGTLFSYSLPDEDNELLLTDYSRFKILIGGRKV